MWWRALPTQFVLEEIVMNRTRLFFIGSIALALGALVSFVVYSRLKTSASADNGPAWMSW